MQEMMGTTDAKSSHRGLYAALGAGALAGAAAVIAYRKYVQPWDHTWGASAEDISREMPGDELLDDAAYVTTRAVEIDATPAEIYPWLIQMGQGRGGAYTYDWIEQALGLNMHSADRIVPELQYLREGEFLPMGNAGEGMIVKRLERDRSLVLQHTSGNWTWEFGLYPTPNGNTRLVSRNRIATEKSGYPFRLYLKLMDPGAFVMERKMLLGIKQRVEKAKLARPQPGPALAAAAGAGQTV